MNRVLKNNKGFSMIQAIVMMTMLSVFGMLFNRMLVDSLKAQQYVRDQNEIDNIRRELLSNMSCVDTLKQFTNIDDCKVPGTYLDLRMSDVAGSARYLVKKDASLDSTPFANSGLFRNQWYVKAKCNNTSIEIRIAKRSPNLAGFAQNALRKQDLNFDAKPNPLFSDQPGNFTMCEGSFTPAAAKIIRVMGNAYLDNNQTLAEGTANLTGVCGGLERTLGNLNPRSWSAAAICPAGYIAVGGGLAQESGGAANPLFVTNIAPQGGVVQSGNQDGVRQDIWNLTLCLYTNWKGTTPGDPTTALTTGFTVPNAVYATCMKKE